MADYSLLIAAIGFIVLAVVIFKIVSSIVKTLLLVTVIGSVVLGIAAFLVITDAQDITEHFAEGPNILLLTDGDQALVALVTSDNVSRLVSKQEVETFSQELAAGNYNAIRGARYKLIAIDIAVIESLEEGSVRTAESNYSAADVRQLHSSGRQEEMGEVLTALFAQLFSQPRLLISQYRDGALVVYKEGAAFKALRIFPTLIVSGLPQKLMNKATVSIDGP
jgi:hypothetical protein